MPTEENTDLPAGQGQQDPFKAEFERALADLMGKIRYRGTAHYEWIADQIVQSVSEDALLRHHLLEKLSKYGEQKQKSA